MSHARAVNASTIAATARRNWYTFPRKFLMIETTMDHPLQPMTHLDMTVGEPYRIRTQPFTYAIFGILLGPIVIAWIYIAHSSTVPSNRLGAVIAGGILAALWSWFLFLGVDLYSDRLVMRTALRKSEISYSDIRKVDILVRSFRGGTGYGWAIYDDGRFATSPLKIPIGPFRVRDQRKIAEMLVEKAPAARIDPWTRSVGASGKTLPLK